MKDLIDERNFREKCSRSIIKNYNVHYVTQEELDAQQMQEQNEETRPQDENLKSAKTEEINVSSDHASSDDMDSQDELNSVTKEQIEKILGERDEFLQEVIQDSKVD